MDVRCEKCQTEYELDESKLKPSGVTVKCSTCGHMFRIRKRAEAGDAPGARTPPPPTPPPVPGHDADDGAGPRSWLIRTPNGEQMSCRELALLQQWIVGGRVTRDCEISRSGKTWKRLGEIAELSSFFRIADEVHASAATAPALMSPPRAQQRPPDVTVRAPHPQPQPQAQRPARPGSAPPPVPAGAPFIEAEPDDDDEHREGPMGKAGKGPAQQRTTAGWASASGNGLQQHDDEGPQGPVGGMARGVPTADAAFATNPQQIRRDLVDQSGGRRTFRTTSLDDDEPLDVPRGGAGKWIVLSSLILLGGAAGALYFFVFRNPGGKKNGPARPVASATIDAGAARPTPPAPPTPPTPPPTAAAKPDAGAATPPVDDVGAAIATAYNALRADSPADLDEARRQLAGLRGDTPGAPLLAALSRIDTAFAQQLGDEALVTGDATRARQLAAEAKTRATSAEQLAKDALAKDAAAADAKVALADALRVRGARGKEVDRYLGEVLAADPKHREALYVRAMLLLRDKKQKDAEKVLDQLAAEGGTEAAGDVRPRYRLAMLAFEAKQYDVARERADAVLKLQPEHAGAKRLRVKLDEATRAVASDPMPPEDDHTDHGAAAPHGGSGGADSYDSALERAERAAESGNCGQAMVLYEKALDFNPSGVAALTGMGYCHIEARQFASAQAKFRAALGISPRYQDALIGVAEAYRYQGLAKQAVEAYQRYLDAFPNGTKATLARKQIEMLGGGQPETPPTPPPEQPFDDKSGGGGQPSGDKPPEEKPPEPDKPPEEKPPEPDKPPEEKPEAPAPEPTGDPPPTVP